MNVIPWGVEQHPGLFSHLDNNGSSPNTKKEKKQTGKHFYSKEKKKNLIYKV